MQIVKYPKKNTWSKYLVRPADDTSGIEAIVKPILEKVKREGDKALKEYALRFDKAKLDSLYVSDAEFIKAEAQVEESLKAAIITAKENIEQFHVAQKQEILTLETMPGVTCSRKSVAIQKVGLYIPGGTAPLFSTVLMLGIPAIIAGCKEIILATPAQGEQGINPVILYTAKLLGIRKVLKVGGSQAIAALAYGTASVPKVDKIFGPGNQYVMMAKQLVSRDTCSIDMPAGPSEVAVFSDETANAAFVASDLLSQAEHGADSQVLLVTTSEALAREVVRQVDLQLAKLPRKEMAALALKNSWILVVEDKQIGLELINEYAPEHLILSLSNADEIADQIVNAGSVFIGDYTPESAGDYASGTNHTLPTSGWASSVAGVSLDSFVKKITFQKITPSGLELIGPTVEKMAEAEQLFAHKNAVSIRLAHMRDHES